MENSKTLPGNESYKELSEIFNAIMNRLEGIKPFSLPSSFKPTYMLDKDKIKLLADLPMRWYKQLVNEHKEIISPGKQSILLCDFEDEIDIAHQLVVEQTKFCVGNDAKNRLEYLNEFEKWFESLRKLFKKYLSQSPKDNSDLEFENFKSRMESEFMIMVQSELNLFNKFDVMSCVTGENIEYIISGLENIGAITNNTLENMHEHEANIQWLDETERELKASVEIIEEKIENYHKTKKKAESTQNGYQLTGEAKALALLVEHPDWTDTDIAKAIGVNRTTLYKWGKFKKAKEALKQGKNKYPRGSKNGESGEIEAWNE